jgi:hypothetical protein
MLAYDYPVMGAFWTMLWFFVWILWIMLLFRVFADIFRNREMSGWVKAAWVIFTIAVPFLGVFVYLIAHGKDMGQRDIEQARTQQQAFDTYVKDVAATGGSADELSKLADLKQRGVINDSEFEQQKAKILAS